MQLHTSWFLVASCLWQHTLGQKKNVPPPTTAAATTPMITFFVVSGMDSPLSMSVENGFVNYKSSHLD
ncbi:MAG: hypothetical protein ABW092_00020 [Candidatus Thiodiazotropha sp.]